MIGKIVEWNQRMDAWQRQGGTPRWMLYMHLLTLTKALPAVALAFGILWVFGTYWPGDPNEMLKLVGLAAIFFWCFNRVEGLYSRYGGMDDS